MSRDLAEKLFSASRFLNVDTVAEAPGPQATIITGNKLFAIVPNAARDGFDWSAFDISDPEQPAFIKSGCKNGADMKDTDLRGTVYFIKAQEFPGTMGQDDIVISSKSWKTEDPAELYSQLSLWAWPQSERPADPPLSYDEVADLVHGASMESMGRVVNKIAQKVMGNSQLAGDLGLIAPPGEPELTLQDVSGWLLDPAFRGKAYDILSKPQPYETNSLKADLGFLEYRARVCDMLWDYWYPEYPLDQDIRVELGEPNVLITPELRTPQLVKKALYEPTFPALVNLSTRTAFMVDNLDHKLVHVGYLGEEGIAWSSETWAIDDVCKTVSETPGWVNRSWYQDDQLKLCLEIAKTFDAEWDNQGALDYIVSIDGFDGPVRHDIEVTELEDEGRIVVHVRDVRNDSSNQYNRSGDYDAPGNGDVNKRERVNERYSCADHGTARATFLAAAALVAIGRPINLAGLLKSQPQPILEPSEAIKASMEALESLAPGQSASIQKGIIR